MIRVNERIELTHSQLTYVILGNIVVCVEKLLVGFFLCIEILFNRQREEKRRRARERECSSYRRYHYPTQLVRLSGHSQTRIVSLSNHTHKVYNLFVANCRNQLEKRVSSLFSPDTTYCLHRSEPKICLAFSLSLNAFGSYQHFVGIQFVFYVARRRENNGT